jgi:Protein of unknown function (DUF732)
MSPIRRVTPDDADPAAETAIGPPAAEETELIPPDQAPTLAAWSLCDSPEVVEYPDQPRSWPLVWGVAAACVGAVALLVGAVGLTSWALRPEPSAPPVAMTEMIPAPPPVVTVTAVPPARTWTPPPPPVTVTVSPKPTPPTTVTVQAAPPTLSEAALDERFLNDLTSGGLRLTDVREVIGDGHQICAYLGAGHSEADAVRIAMRNNTTFTYGNAETLIESAVQVYCPEMAGR